MTCRFAAGKNGFVYYHIFCIIQFVRQTNWVVASVVVHGVLGLPQEELQRIVFPRQGVIDLPSWQINDFSQKVNRKKLVSGQTWVKSVYRCTKRQVRSLYCRVKSVCRRPKLNRWVWVKSVNRCPKLWVWGQSVGVQSIKSEASTAGSSQSIVVQALSPKPLLSGCQVSQSLSKAKASSLGQVSLSAPKASSPEPLLSSGGQVSQSLSKASSLGSVCRHPKRDSKQHLNFIVSGNKFYTTHSGPAL